LIKLKKKTAQTRVKFNITGEKCVNLKFTDELKCQAEKNRQIHLSSSFLQQPKPAPPDSSCSEFLGKWEVSFAI